MTAELVDLGTRNVLWNEPELGMVGICVGRLRTYVLKGELLLELLWFIAFEGLLILLPLALCLAMSEMFEIVLEADW